MLLTCRMASVRKSEVLLAMLCRTPGMCEGKLRELSSAAGRGEGAELALTNRPNQYHKEQCLCSGDFAGGCCSLAVEVTHLPFSGAAGLISTKCGIVNKNPMMCSSDGLPCPYPCVPFLAGEMLHLKVLWLVTSRSWASSGTAKYVLIPGKHFTEQWPFDPLLEH